MALWGVSGSDATNNGWNTVVGLGVLAGCAGAALVVKTIAAKVFAYSSMRKEAKEKYSAYVGLGFGLVAAAAVYKFVPGSRFDLITDDSTSKMFKLGAAQAVSGFVIDYFAGSNYIATIGCLGGAVATRFAYPVLAVLGVFGAGLGSGLIPTTRSKEMGSTKK